MAETSMSEMLEAATQRCRDMDAPLGQRLQTLAEEVRRLSPQFADVVERMVTRLAEAGAGARAPAAGDLMPPFLLPDQRGQLVHLDRLIAGGPVVVSFNRGHWCPYCRINAAALARIEPEVKALGAQIVAITPEVERFCSELRQDADASFPILSDIDNAYALELNLAIMINDEKRQAMTAGGFDIAPFNASDAWTLPIPATFVIGRDGRVKARFVDPDYRKRMDVDEVLAALKNV